MLIVACVVLGPGSLLVSPNLRVRYGYILLWLLVLAGVFMGTYVAMAAYIVVAAGAAKRNESGEPDHFRSGPDGVVQSLDGRRAALLANRKDVLGERRNKTGANILGLLVVILLAVCMLYLLILRW